MTEPARMGVPIYSVADLLGGLRELLEQRVGRVWVVGEISNLRRPGSGHTYFTLKDDAGQVRAALFRAAARRLPFEPEDGLEVLVYGDLTVYEARGDLQIIVRHLEPRGEGALRLAFEQLRRRLEQEGLFDANRKRELPELPRCVGVVASPTSAALRDVLQVTGRRCPSLPLLVAPTRVQGEGAEQEVADALDALGASGAVDCIILVRGGGSLEDLQAFNTETVARAMARCPVPVVCGVGHEVDFTIADWVADLRAPTPSAAAELVAPDRRALGAALERDWRRLRAAVAASLEQARARLARESDAVAMLAPSARLAARRERLWGAAQALPRAARAGLALRKAHFEAAASGLQRQLEAAAGAWERRLASCASRLESLSPLAVLSRGYALVRRAADGAVVRRPEQLATGERIAVRVAEAELEATVEAVRKLPPRA